ncbi:hypothetical protein RFF05_13000 [Bengtsoniella intestinalis]|uniref:hypothetical protein n=1 Tax=Bengtsoniella intestinalis TaxID=3073143 RepID=UPI00391F345C
MGFRGSSGALAVGLGALTCEVIEKTVMTGAELLGGIAIMLGKRDSASGGDSNSYFRYRSFHS